MPNGPARPTSSQPIDTYRHLLIAGTVTAIAVFLGLSIVLILQGSPFGHDESVYSLRARYLVEGLEPVFFWNAYRAPGLPFVLQAAWIASATEPYLRLITAMFGIPLVAATAFIGNRMFGPRAALVATIGLATTPVVLGAATQVWPDVPGAAIGLAAIALYVLALDRPAASAWMLGVPVLTFLATMFRFGAPIPIAIGLIGITLWRWRVALASRVLVASTAALTIIAGYLVLYAPVVTGWAQFGNPMPPAEAIASLVGRNDLPWYSAFITYLGTGRDLFGGIPSLLLAFGLVSAIVLAVRRADGRQSLWTAFGIAVGTIAVISLVLHGESRYLTPAFPWLWMAAGYGIASLIRTPDRTLAIAIAVILTMFVSVDTVQRSSTQNVFNSDAYSAIKTAGQRIDTANEDNACGVISGYVPQIGWYSHCPTRRYNLDKVKVTSPFFGSGPRFLVLVEGGKRQPSGEVLNEYLEVAEGPIDTVGTPLSGNRQYVEIWLVTENG